MFANAKAFYSRHPKWVPIVFFLVGFVFDAFMLRRIDDLFSIVQQAIYLAVAGALINLELLEFCGKYHPGTGPWSKVWRFREAIIHFMLGTLLNAYTIFYFKSASVLTSFVFVGFLVTVLMLSEFKKFDESQTIVHMTLWCLCLISYSIYLVPTLIGAIGVFPFLVAILCSLTMSIFIFIRLRQAAQDQRGLVYKRVLYPFALMHLLFLGLYFARAIPPVPLSVSFIGIYHDVQKQEDQYLLTYTDTAWEFLHNGDQEFKARSGDKLYCFARIFSPTRFQDRLMVRWLYKDAKRRWLSSDTIPMPITGGREEGFRGYTVKSNYWPGDWRCQIETSDGQEIGRITFHVSKDEGTEERAVRTKVQ